MSPLWGKGDPFHGSPHLPLQAGKHSSFLREHLKWSHPTWWSELEGLLLLGLHDSHVTLKVAQSCPTLCDPMDCSPPSSSVHGILQARILEWAAKSFSRGIFLTRSLALQADTWPSEPPGKTAWPTRSNSNASSSRKPRNVICKGVSLQPDPSQELLLSRCNVPLWVVGWE